MAKFEGLSVVWLEALVAVADSEKRMQAAEAMGVTDGTVTKHVANLERWLGKVLVFDGSVELTPDGHRLVTAARQILELLEQAGGPLPATRRPPRARRSVRGATPNDR